MAENKRRLASHRQCCDDAADITDKAKVEHAIGFVEDEVADLVQLQLVVAIRSQTRPGCANDDVGACAHPLHLREPAHAANDCNHAILLPAQLAQAFLDLQGQFAGRCEDERTGREAMGL